MKKAMILVSLFVVSQVFSQEIIEKDDGRNEVKLNATNLIGFQYMDITYETLVNEESSFGLGLLFKFGFDQDDFIIERKFSITPFYRKFFSKGRARGFFVEGFGMYSSGEYDRDTLFGLGDDIADYHDFALGISVGGKFLTRKGFIAEIYGGIGRNMLGNDNSPDVVSRGGISIGFRF